MRHLKTFENYSINEEFIFDKLKLACEQFSKYLQEKVLPKMPESQLQKLEDKIDELTTKHEINNFSEFTNIVTKDKQKLELSENFISENFFTNVGAKLKSFGYQIAGIFGLGSFFYGVVQAASFLEGWADYEFLSTIHNLSASVFGETLAPIFGWVIVFGSLLLIGWSFKKMDE
jgi:hypothetical protein